MLINSISPQNNKPAFGTLRVNDAGMSQKEKFVLRTIRNELEEKAMGALVNLKVAMSESGDQACFYATAEKELTWFEKIFDFGHNLLGTAISTSLSSKDSDARIKQKLLDVVQNAKAAYLKKVQQSHAERS